MQKQFTKSCLLGVGLLGLAGITQAAQAELTANAGVTSNYVFRGVTQTDDGIAIQGGVDYVHEVGVYAGAWASNVETGTGDKGYETDLYVGYNFKLNEDVVFDVGYITYIYSSVAISDAEELYFGAAFKDVSVTYYLGDTDGAGNTDYSYIDLKYSMALSSDYNLHLHYGNFDGDAGGDYEDVAVGVSTEFEGFDIGLTATSIDYDGATDDENEFFITASKVFNLM